MASFMDPARVTKETAQLGFIRFVLMPLFESLAVLFPQLVDLMVVPLRRSLDYYARLEEKERAMKS